MPRPYEFKSESELIDMLGQEKTRLAAQHFFAMESGTINDVVTTGVTGNTFRAFRNLNVKPSITFRNWAADYLQKSVANLSNYSTELAYSDYVHNATLSLCDEWKNITNSEMGYGRGAKLFNLVLKKFVCLESLSPGQKQTLISLQHVPLDSYTIIGLRSISPEFSIPKNATMKFVESLEQYIKFQKKIATITSKAGVPAIYYDILAWDMGH